MKRVLSLVMLTLLLLAASACAAKKTGEPVSYKSKNILSAIRDLNKAYENKDQGLFLARVAPTFPDREAYAKTIASVFAKYETIRFNIQYNKMLIVIEDKGQIKTTFTWDADWTAPGGSLQKNGGRATLVFEPGSFRLSAIDGKDPFIPQAGGEISGATTSLK